MKPAFWWEQHRLKGNEPAVWVLQARRLKQSADTILEAYSADLARLQAGEDPRKLEVLESFGPMTRLYGLAVENLLKAVIVKTRGPRISNGRLAGWPGSGHDLRALATEAALSVDAAEADLLGRLTAYVKWAGRYPIPIRAEDMPLSQRGVRPAWFPLPVQVMERFILEDLFQRLEAAAGVTRAA